SSSATSTTACARLWKRCARSGNREGMNMSITKEEWRAMKSLGDEATKVTAFLERRGHNPDEACAVMGVALARLIDNRGMLESFIDALRTEYRVVRGLVRLAAVLLTFSAAPAAAFDYIDCSMVIGHLTQSEQPENSNCYV